MGALSPKPPLPPGLSAEAYLEDLRQRHREITTYRTMTITVWLLALVCLLAIGVMILTSTNT